MDAPIARILVVDDNPQNRQLAEAVLAGAGYDVTPVDSGEHALASCAAAPPDLVLLDLLMPGIDGFETCRQLRRMPSIAHTPIVFLTALGDAVNHQAALESGADDFLTKPLQRVELLLRVRSLLRIKQLSDQAKRDYELIRSQRDTLVRVEKQKEELTRLIVHDLKNPLTNILANANFLLDEPDLAASSRDAIADIATGAEAMHRMVLNILDVSLGDEGALRPRPVELDAVTLVQETVRSMAHRADERRMQLAVTAPSEVLRLHVDGEMLRRMLENLIENAIRYAPVGDTIRVSLRLDGAEAELRVSDAGETIPEALRAQVFEKYARIESHKPAVPGSRGLGLVFCHHAAVVHGGRIWVEPILPRGNSFCVRLPVAPLAAPAPPSAH